MFFQKYSDLNIQPTVAKSLDPLSPNRPDPFSGALQAFTRVLGFRGFGEGADFEEKLSRVSVLGSTSRATGSELRGSSALWAPAVFTMGYIEAF